ncbi:MAG: type II secretion system protein [Deltaproteobacteria bacterium]|nr:type II secretion system protein [Deltaproteobacteria bacterium]
MMKREQNSGFTLIEITVVISLISIMFFFTVPRFRNAVLTDSVNDTSRWIIGKVRVLKEYSTTKQKLTILHINMDSNKMWVSDETMTQEDLEKAHEKGFEIPEDVKVINVEYPQKGIVSAGQADICFYRAGYSDKVLIHIQGDDERKLSFLIEPFLPKVKLYEKYVDFEDS